MASLKRALCPLLPSTYLAEVALSARSPPSPGQTRLKVLLAPGHPPLPTSTWSQIRTLRPPRAGSRRNTRVPNPTLLDLTPTLRASGQLPEARPSHRATSTRVTAAYVCPSPQSLPHIIVCVRNTAPVLYICKTWEAAGDGDKTPGIIYESPTRTLGLYLLNEWLGPAISWGIYVSPGAEDTRMWRCKNDKFSDSAEVVFHCLCIRGEGKVRREGRLTC